MYYVSYRLDTLKVVHKDTKPLKPQLDIYGVAEYKGDLPKGDWLSVDNIREEIETWKEKEVNEQGQEVEVQRSKTHILCDLVAHFYPKRELTEEQKAKLKEKQYNALTTRLIRKKYDANAVEALLANYAEDKEKYQEEFNTFAAYRAECKALAREQVYGG